MRGSKLFVAEESQPQGSVYDAVSSPFKKATQDFLPDALRELNRRTEFTPQQKLVRPVEAAFAKASQIPAMQQDNTVTPNLREPVMPDIIAGPSSPFKRGNKMVDIDKFRNDTAARESNGNINATNKNSSAQGKFQFLWGSWGDSIQKVTGVKSKEEFRASEAAQDKFFNFYANKVVVPAVNKLKPLAAKYDLSDNEVAQIVHFRGEAGAERALRENLLDKKLEKSNMTINKYIGRK